jgi:hypothetical protein
LGFLPGFCDRIDDGLTVLTEATSCWQVELMDVVEEMESDRTDDAGVCRGELINGVTGDAAKGELGVASPPSLELVPGGSALSSSTVAW